MATGELDLRHAAAELGVHYQTAYNWVRTGKLEARIVAGQYRLDAAQVAAFQRARQVPTRRRTGSIGRRRNLQSLNERLYTLLAEGEETKARRMIRGLVETDGLTPVTERLLVPVMARIGDEWQQGKAPISLEHRASGIIERMLGELHPMPSGRRRGVAVVAALAGDRHSLPTTMAAGALREDNWHVHHLGADLPTSEVRSFCQEAPVDLVVVTVTMPEPGRSSDRLASELEQQGVRVLVGTPGASLSELQDQAKGTRSGT